MSVVAWDGKTLAADKRAVNNGSCSTTTKMARASDGAALAWVGEIDTGGELVKWYNAGADPCDWPETQKDKEKWNRFIVALGVLHSAVAGNDYCNGMIAPIQPPNQGACMVDCLHVDDLAEILTNANLGKCPAGK